ncbi:type IX secretion system periplasmic lipoprotein PorW/SprE [Croceiramulus getboli]|nr:hypothetical protein P8624_04415 [Flavobacteriaceae bacterium YJPT1-3]
MNKHTTYIILLILLIAAAWGCSRKNDTFINRNFHAVTTEYNTLYNGNLALEEGLETVVANYQDNFWELLPVERLEQFETIALPGKSKTPSFERAEEKAIKAIQKHSMEIDGKERNPQIDEAFMMLGKARYYDGRFIPALESFNYILATNPLSNNIAQANVWKAKTNLRLNNEEVAIKNLRRLLELEEKNLSDQDYADATSTLAQAFINTDQPDSAAVYMVRAAQSTRNNEQKGRFWYITGQLYEQLGHVDTATMAYEEVIALNRKTPREYLINAQLRQIDNFDADRGEVELVRELLTELEENRENRPFLDKIYYQTALYFAAQDQQDSAVVYYNKSLRSPGRDTYLKSLNYVALGDLNFDQAAYLQAGAYYDSTLTALDARDRAYRQIKKKKDNLTEVIRLETLATTNDSILRLARMSVPEREAYFDDYIAELKAAEEKAAATQDAGIRNDEFYQKQQQSQAGGAFYFYNTTATAYGKDRFRQKWGDRPLQDNWRFSTTRPVQNAGVPGLPDITADIPADQASRFDRDVYMAEVPQDPVILDSLIQERDQAYYQLGLIYKEKFKENNLAIARLEQLLANEPAERLILPAKYYLYQLYRAENAFAKAESLKEELLLNYPDSRYAAIISNPNAQLEAATDTPEAQYKKLYKQFEAQEYEAVLTEADVLIDAYTGLPSVPKLELLKAMALGRLEGQEAYAKALNFIAVTYPNSAEGKQAQQLLKTQVPQLAFTTFADETISRKWKLLFPLAKDEREQAQLLREKISQAVDTLGYRKSTASVDVYNRDTLFVVVHGFNTQMGAQGFAELLRTDKTYAIKRESIPISSENYRIIQIHKNLSAYREEQLD